MKKTENAFTSKEPLTNMYKYQVKSQSGKRGGAARASVLGGKAVSWIGGKNGGVVRGPSSK